MFYVTYVKDSKKQEKWFETRDAASDHLQLKAAIDLYNKIPRNGSIETRAKALIDALPDYNVAIDGIDERIEEWVRPSK